MKKYFVVVLLVSSLLLLTGCIQNQKNTTTSTELPRNYSISKLENSKINEKGSYALNCNTNFYTNTTIGGELIEKSSIKVSEGNESATLYVEGETAKFFGADFTVIQDNNNFLIIMRTYGVSGLTEVVTINKTTGIGFDTKTFGYGISGAPVSTNYLLTCDQI